MEGSHGHRTHPYITQYLANENYKKDPKKFKTTQVYVIYLEYAARID